MMTTSAAVAVSPIILETLEAELEPEPEFGSMPPPEVLVDAGDEEDALLDACCRLMEELWSVADALVDADADEVTEDPLELAESSVDKLMDASVEDEVDVEKLPELESDSGALELEEANSELLPVESDELLDESRGSELAGSPTEIDPALEDEESRAVALVTVTARRRTEKTFIDNG
ncbi:hypothetical protein KRP22_013608 [Phytophthora ramorum]|nr:hypothetical protein KRP22_11214 [Phytophthora ramorum]